MNNNQKGINNPYYKHGEAHTKLYHVWENMKKRCLNPNFKQYKDYGGRGITICPEWTESYIEFRDWALSNGYAEGLQINRIENDGNYEPSNCNFVTCLENIKNRRKARTEILTLEKANEIRRKYKIGNYMQKVLAKEYNVNFRTISNIINNKIWKQ